MFALTHAQKRIVINQQIFPDSKFAHMYGRVDIPGQTVLKLTDAINAAIAFYDCLRIQFVRADSEIQQRIVGYRYEDIALRPSDYALLDEELPLFGNALYRFYIVEEKGSHIGYFFVFHHAILDAYTITLILRFIQDYLTGKPQDAKPRSFRGIAEAEQPYLRSDEFKQDYAYFEKQLSRALCYKYVPDFDLRSNRIEYAFTGEQSNALLSYCKQRNISVFKLIYAALFLLLYMEDGKTIQTISTTHHNRDTETLLQTGGMLASTLPVLCEIDTALSFEDFLARVAANINESLTRHAFPIDSLLTHKKDAFDLDITAVMLNSIPFGDGSCITRFSPKGDAACLNFKLNPHSKTKGANIEIALDYRISRYTQNQAQQMLERLAHNAFMFIEHGASAIADVITSPKDIMIEIQQAMEDNPGQTALSDTETTLTYRQLNEYSNAVAGALIESNGAGHVVGVINERSVWYVVALLGILKAGKAFTVLDLDHPAQRLNEMANQTKLKTVLSFSDKSQPVWEGTTVVDVRRLTPMADRRPIQVSGLAYILFTSGSSGTPKGVMVGRPGLLPLVKALMPRLGTEKGQRFLAYCDFSFDVSIAEIFLSLYAAGTLFITNNEQRQNLKELDKLVRKNHINHAFLPTQAGEAFIRHFPECPLISLTIAGEKMTYYRQTGYATFNGYGPTEFTCLSHMERIEKAAERYSIGTALNGVSDQIVNDDGQPAQTGELILWGKQAALGYLHDYKRTSRQFVKTLSPDGTCFLRGYKTGDKVERSGDGKLYFLYRMDRQIKHNGYRIELGEIENAAINTGLASRAVCTYEDKKIRLAIKKPQNAGINETGTDSALADKILRMLMKKLPHYALPHSVTVVADFEKAKTGKTIMQDQSNENNAGISTLTEKKLLEVFSDYIPDGIAVTDNLLNSGIDSLDMLQIMLDVEQRFNYSLQFSDYITYPTIRQLAAYIEKASAVDRKAPVDDCRLVTLREGTGRPLILVFDMSRDIIAYRWLIGALRPGYPIYGIVAGLIPSDTTLEVYVDSLKSRILQRYDFDACDLAGYSSGGTIAFVLAGQLEHKAGCVFLVDAPNYSLHPKRMNFRFILENIGLALTAYGMKGVLAYGRKLFREFWHKRNAISEGRKLKALIRAYKPEKPSSPLYLFAASETAARTDARLGWQGIIEDNRIIRLNGRHISVMKKSANEIAQVIDNVRQDNQK